MTWGNTGKPLEGGEFDDVPKTRKAAKLLAVSANPAATENERRTALAAALAAIKRYGLDPVEVDAAACKLAELPRGSFSHQLVAPKTKRRFWHRESRP